MTKALVSNENDGGYLTRTGTAISEIITCLLLLTSGQQPLDQANHWRDKVLEGVELVRPSMEYQMCQGPHSIEAHLEAGVISNGPVTQF